MACSHACFYGHVIVKGNSILYMYLYTHIHVGGYISVPPGPRSGGLERGSRTGLLGSLAQLGSRALLAAFWALKPMPMAGMDTRASIVGPRGPVTSKRSSRGAWF